MQNKLLPCPFCGGESEPKRERIRCSNRDCKLFNSEMNLLEWNTRAESQQSESLKAENENLKKALEFLDSEITRAKNQYGAIHGKIKMLGTVCGTLSDAQNNYKKITAALAQPKE